MKALLVGFAAILLLPAAAADVSHSTTFEGGAIPYDGTLSIPIQVQIGCDVVLASGGGSASVLTAGLPGWLNATSTVVLFEPMECLPGATATLAKQANLDLTAAADAPGLVNTTLNATIVYVGEVGDPFVSPVALPAVHVSYRPGHVMTPDGDQTFTVTNGTFSFDMKVDITANARTMIMFEDKRVQGGGLLTGLQAHVFNVPEGERNLVQPVRFTAPQGNWDTVKVSFRNYSHCLDGPDCGEQLEANITWTFKNGGPVVEPAADQANSKDAPGLLVPALLLSLAAVAIVRRRQA